MARVEILPIEHSKEMTTVSRVQADLAGILAHRPEASDAFSAFSRELHGKGTLPSRLVELVRLRIAFHNQCRSCMAMRYDAEVTEDLVCSLEKPHESPDLTDAEKAALKFADLFATNHLGINDALYVELGEHFTQGEIVELGLHCAKDVGMGRLAATWNVTDNLPPDMKPEGQVNPWDFVGLRKHRS